MLPKGPLGRDKFKNLKVYKEDSHPHVAKSGVISLQIILWL